MLLIWIVMLRLCSFLVVILVKVVMIGLFIGLRIIIGVLL